MAIYQPRTSARLRINTKIGHKDPAKLPKGPGLYYWSAWKAVVRVYKKKGGRHLYVKPPGARAVEVRISPRIAGEFTPYEGKEL